MAWIESHQDLAQHPKTKRFARSADISIPTAIGHLHLLWWWCMTYADDGCLSKWEASDIADAVHWNDDPEKLLETLVASRFLDNVDGLLSIHDWDDYTGRLMDVRRKDKERKRKSRENLRKSAVTEPNPTEPDQTQNHITVAQHNNLTDDTERFWRMFWENYPKKTFETEARQAWDELCPDETLAVKILKSLENAKCSEQWIKSNGRFINKAVTWLKNKPWEGDAQNYEHTNGAKTFNSNGMSDFRNALDNFDDEGNEIATAV